MQRGLLALVFLVACGDDGATVELPECGTCDVNARCVLTGDTAACECDPGYEGDGATCTDIDECVTSNGGCHANATCSNTDGGRSCACNDGFEGTGETCVSSIDITKAGCAVRESEHPGYTNIARDVVLCGSRYTAANIAQACATGWHVCKKTEWTARYPTNRPYGMDPDPIGATIGQYTSWGAPQFLRCGGNVWIPNAPEDTTMPYDGTVCYYDGDEPGNADGADYLPQNNGKFLFDDDGTTVLQGRNAQGNPDCCSWDVMFDAQDAVDGFAVYCCKD